MSSSTHEFRYQFNLKELCKDWLVKINQARPQHSQHTYTDGPQKSVESICRKRAVERDNQIFSTHIRPQNPRQMALESARFLKLFKFHLFGKLSATY